MPSARRAPRLRDVHLHDVRLRGQGEAKPLPRIQRDPDAAAACFLDQVPIALVGRAPRQGARDREPAPAFPSHRGGVGELDPRGVRGDGTVLVELGESGGLTVGDRQRGPALPMGPDELALHAFGGEGFLQPPTRVSQSATTQTSAPSDRAARATFSPLPPATCTKPDGRWMSPLTNRSTSNSRSTDGFAARQTIIDLR